MMGLLSFIMELGGIKDISNKVKPVDRGPNTCPVCKGAGTIPCQGYKHDKACACSGTGVENCYECGGSGTVSL